MPGKRIGGTALLVLLWAAPAAAQSDSAIPLRTLETRWQTEIPHKSADRAGDLRLGVGSDGRLSFGVPDAMLVTLDASGKIVQRAAIRGELPFRSSLEALASGDFLAHVVVSKPVRRFELRRYAPDGKLRFRESQPLKPDLVEALHGAVMLASGHIVALKSTGLGPNDELQAVMFNPAGRRIWNHRTRVALGSEMYSRLYALSPESGRQSFVVVANALQRRDSLFYFLQRFTFNGRRVMADPPQVLGCTGEMRCSAVGMDGSAALGVVPREARSLILEWYDAARRPKGRYAFAEVEPCDLMRRRDRGTLVLLGARRMVAFGPDAKPLWRAEFARVALAVAWLPDGDIAVVDGTETALRVTRYTPR